MKTCSGKHKTLTELFECEDCKGLFEISIQDVENWLGSDNTLKEALFTIKDIANGSYDPKTLAREILEYRGAK